MGHIIYNKWITILQRKKNENVKEYFPHYLLTHKALMNYVICEGVKDVNSACSVYSM